ncbi:HD domain-containing protein [Actomonas aquatica]|uniref:HD domain-containing protein n=1 Tax=Actomonas aquatica TaxID=2866162 RepID=A0ABZ1CBK0_9BACT|nr:HD domain-containing protein [Opitutus sp. WL0086]WRQ89052.1 HD domain-containing protein [Opitutus sp. WL0086]
MNLLLHAAYFAAVKHSDQRRKNTAAAPYINHPLEVACHLSEVGGITDEAVLIAAVLHDTVEDTATTREEIATTFGETVAALVMECTDDKSLEKAERKRLQVVNAPKKSPGAKAIKIADKTCNLRSILVDPPAGWSWTRQYDYFLWANKVVAGLLGHHSALDADVQRVLQEGLDKLQPLAAAEGTA